MLAPILSLSLSVACGSSNNSSTSPQAADGGGDAATQFAAYCSDLATVTCEAVANCCNMTIDACRTAEHAACLTSESDFSVPGAQFNAANAQACLAGLPSSVNGCAYAPTSSPEYQATSLACRSLLVGTLPPGSECTSSGLCATPPGSHGACLSDSSGIKRCAAAPLSNKGDACGGLTFVTCASGLFCDSSATSNLCAPLKADGATCRSGIECLSQICTNSTCAEPTIDQFCRSLSSN